MTTAAWREIEILFKVLIEKTRDGPPADTPDDRSFLVVLGEGKDEGEVITKTIGGGNSAIMVQSLASLLYVNPQLIGPFTSAVEAAVDRLTEEGKLTARPGTYPADPDVDMLRRGVGGGK